MGKNNAKIIDVNTLIQAGIDPKTGLPIKMGSVDCLPQANIKKQLRIMDEQDAINSFTWYNLPPGLNAKLIERILYYRGQGVMFPLNGKFYFLPYTLHSTPEEPNAIDVYGRFTGITPLPFNGTSIVSINGKKETPWIEGLHFTPIYDILTEDEINELSEEELEKKIKNSCVILKDYTPQYSETNISRQVLNDPLLDLMADCLPFMRTALLNSTGVNGMRVESQDEYAEVYRASSALTKAALEGNKYVPIVGHVEFQELVSGNVGKAEEFLLAMQSLDNYRLSLHGLDNGGLFLKKSHMLEAEQKMNVGTTGLVLRDKLTLRQEFCMIANTIWDCGMWVEPSEPVMGIDINGDGIATNGEMREFESDNENDMEGGNDYDE